MEQIAALTERIRTLKSIAASMHEGAFHTQLFPEIDKVLALPDELEGVAIGEREAIARQVRDYEQSFDRLGYTLLEQLMPAVGVSPVFEIVQASDEFKAELRGHMGQSYGEEAGQRIDAHVYDVLTRYSLSIGTPPVTSPMRELVARTVLGRTVEGLYDYVETLRCEPDQMRELLDHVRALVDSSLHYCTAAEEQEFLRRAADFANFEGGRILNRVAITESPERVIDLLCNHVFDKFAPGAQSAVQVVEGVDRLGWGLVTRMQAEPNRVFVVRVTKIPYWLFQPLRGDNMWRSVLGRLVLIDTSERARQSNTTIVHTLFPHVTRTLRNVQTSLAGRPANTQLQLRCVLERFSPAVLRQLLAELDVLLGRLQDEGVGQVRIDEVRRLEWRGEALFDYLALIKLRRLVRFLEQIASSTDEARQQLGAGLRQSVAERWMRYFYSGLDPAVYQAAVVPGGGRGALTLVGEFHRAELGARLDSFVTQHLDDCVRRLDQLKREMHIPDASTDEIQAAIKHSHMRAVPSSHWLGAAKQVTLGQHVAKSVLYRAVQAARKVAHHSQIGLERAAYGNYTGPAAALVKRAMGQAGFSALHGRLEQVVGRRMDKYDQSLRNYLVPLQELIRAAKKASDDIKGELDPVSVGEIEAILQSIAQGAFYPTLIVPELAWSYHDVFPDKHFPARWTIRVPLNDRHEMEPLELLRRLEELRYALRRFPEVFALICSSMLLVINSPHNPTGVVYRRLTLLRLLFLAAEYGITLVDDNAYHKLVSSRRKAREGDECLAQVYEKHRSLLPAPVRIITVAATTKGLQGSGDRTGLVHSNDPQVARFADQRASEPHLLSLYLTQLKLESGLAAKHWTGKLERLAAEMLAPGAAASPQERLGQWLNEQLEHLSDDDFPVAVFETALEGYEQLLRLQARGASITELSRGLSALVHRLKQLRPEKALRTDVEMRLQQARAARERAAPQAEDIRPDGAFYYCVRLCKEGDDRGVGEFLRALCRYRKVDVTYAGRGFVRLSLGGRIAGDQRSYERLGLAVETYLRILFRAWDAYEQAGRDPAALPAIFGRNGQALQAMMADLQQLLDGHPPGERRVRGLPVTRDEQGTIYCIEDGRSVTDKVFIGAEVCESVPQMLVSRPFRVVYRRLLRKVYRKHAALTDLSFAQVENQYGAHACLRAFEDRQLIDDLFRHLMRHMYETWHGGSTVKVLVSSLHADRHVEKTAALHGLNRRINELINDLMHAFEIPEQVVRKSGTFDIGYESLQGLKASALLPPYLRPIVQRSEFAGASAPLNPSPRVVTGADRRVSDVAYGFVRREMDSYDAPPSRPALAHFGRRLQRFAEEAPLRHYVCKGVQVGPFLMLLLIHKSCFHLLSDEMRLFPQLEAVQLRERLDEAPWEAALLFGIPAKTMGASYKTGFVLDQRADGRPFPLSWVAREDATDYVGFFKKSLLTMHNELVKALGGMPVHGAMITITFKNGLRKTLVFSADSGTGKSETITAMMEQLISASGPAAELRRIDILASDMLSLWKGEDEQIYAFGTETGDFLRLNDITDGWKAHFGDLLKRGAYSNPDHPKNARVTIPGICQTQHVLTPTRVNGFFYINNYEPVGRSAVELTEDPHHLLKHVLVRGLRKNKGTSGDQPSLRAGLEFARESALVVRFRHDIDALVDWQPRDIEGRERTCLVYRDGAADVFAAKELVTQAFRGKRFELQGRAYSIAAVHFDVVQNVFWLRCDPPTTVVLDRAVYDQIYEPLASTFCGNPFVHPRGMERTLQRFASAMLAAKVHPGTIRTQLGRSGYEFSGPARAAQDIVSFLMEDEEVNARFQRNKDKVHQAMQATYGGVLEAGNLPVELEGYNLLLLEEHESTHVAFVDEQGQPFTLSTPHYEYHPQATVRKAFAPAIAVPETLAVVADICTNPDYDLSLPELDADLGQYDCITYWNSIEELTYQVLLVNGVISLGSSETEVARFPYEVRKAHVLAQLIAQSRPARAGAALARISGFPAAASSDSAAALARPR